MVDNNPAGGPPESSSSSPLDQDILETLSLGGDTIRSADQIAAEPGSTPTPAASEPPASGSPTPSEAGAAVGSAPAAPDTPPPSGTETPTTPAAPTPSTGTPPGGTTPLAPAPTEPPAAAPQPPATLDGEAALREASLRAQIDALSRTVEELRASPQRAPAGQTPMPAPAATESGQPAAEPLLKYNLTLPEATRNALLSEDPQQNLTAINAIVNDLGTIVHHTVVAQLRGEMRTAFQSLISTAQQSETATSNDQARQKAREDYFKAFPTHKNDLIEPIIRQQALALSSEHPGVGWNESYINALGARVNAALEQLGARPTPAEPTPTPAPSPAPKPPAFLPSGTRGSTPTPTGDVSGDIMATLDPFSEG